MDKTKPSETLLVIVTGLIVIYLVKRSVVFLDIAVIVSLLGLLAPVTALWLHRAWMGLAKLLGAVSEKIVLTLIYILILIPVSALAKLSGKFRLDKNPEKDSYFKERNHRYTKDDLENLW
ncbi:MAG TPA: SxtJ family membrane protein [Chitinophagaceae bacterium]|jgi:hypothetical protein